MRTAKWLLLLALLLALGCQKEVHTGGTPNPNRYQHVVSLSPSTSELAVGLYVENLTLVGKTASCNWPKTQTKDVPVVMDGVKPAWEDITALAPDVIVYDADLFSEADLAKAKELKIPIVGFKATNLDEFVKELYVWGSMTGGELKVADYVDKIVSARTFAKGNMPATKVKTAVLLPGDGSEHMIMGKDSFVASILKECGAEVVGPEGALFQPLNAEALIGMNPDLIITSGSTASVEKDKRLSSITAIKNGKISGIDPDRLLRKGARVNALTEALSKVVVNASK